jgi:hypothetical protein
MRYSLFLLCLLMFASCTSVHKTIKQPTSYVELERDDFDLSDQKTAEATSVTIIGIDFARMFMRKSASNGAPSAASIPIVGQYLADQTTSYAMYNLLQYNPGSDFIFYPQTEKKIICPILGICLVNKITTVKVSSRLGTFK